MSNDTTREQWTTPEVSTLTVSLDTAFGPGSSGDGISKDPGTGQFG
jgi:hypothetical protein